MTELHTEHGDKVTATVTRDDALTLVHNPHDSPWTAYQLSLDTESTARLRALLNAQDRVVIVRVNGEAVGRARLVGVDSGEEGVSFTFETLTPGEAQTGTQTPAQEPEPQPAPAPMQEHGHVWIQVDVDSNEYRTTSVADPRASIPQPGLVCHGPGPCVVIDDPERGAWAGTPLNLVLEGDPRE